MLPGSRVLLVGLALVAVVFSGCLGAEDPVDTDTPLPTDDPKLVTSKDGRDLRTELTKEDELPAPKWVQGEAFGIHVYFGPDDSAGTHMNAIVAEDKGDAWYVAPDDPDVAKDEAMWDIPIFGDIKKSDLSSTGFGADWGLFEFPLFDGKVWQGQFTVPSFSGDPDVVYDIDFIVNYEPAIETPDGPRPGFRIMGHTVADGTMIMEYSYTPSIGWLAHFWLYDLTTTDQSDYIFHVMNMGHSYNWTGTYYSTVGQDVMEANSHVIINPDDPTTPVVEPSPYQTFTMAEGGTYLYGIVYAFAFGGGMKVVLIDPNNERHEFDAGIIRQGADPQAFDFMFRFIDLPAVAGEWKVGLIGGGVITGGGVMLRELTETTAEIA